MKKNPSESGFHLTLEECKLILDHIDGLVVVDQMGRTKYLSPDMESRVRLIGELKSEFNYYGKDIEAIHPLTKIKRALTMECREDLVFYLTTGMTNVAKIKPLRKDGKLLGAIDYDLFFNQPDIKRFFDIVVQLSLQGYLNLSESIEQILKKHEKTRAPKYRLSDIVGDSPKMKALKQMLYNMAESDSTVLITGETGCGKELIAHAIHYLSHRGNGRLVEVNCAAIPDSLVESELFGYEEGSFTGAKKGGMIGKFESADGGTIFLDEVDHLPYHIQPKFLRVLQEREVDRIGGKTIPINVRVIAATNKNLKELVEKGLFREDLYYRLNVLHVNVPPLRDRKMDIPLLTDFYLKKLSNTSKKYVEGVSYEVRKLLLQYDWPGNVRELFNVLERGFNMCSGNLIEEDDLKDFFFDTIKICTNMSGMSLEKVREEAEKEAILRALEVCEGNRSKASALLGTSRPNLYSKLEKYHLVGNVK